MLVIADPAVAQDEPALPPGLGGSDDEVATPVEPESDWRESLPFDLTGFVDARAGVRTQDDPDQDQASLGELRAQFEAEKAWPALNGRLTFDLLYDEIARRHRPRLETGQGWFDLREAFLATRVGDHVDLKLGRQILTWGTGDLIFINDLFPKDFVSFFAGRDTSYLKAPSDALKASFFSRVVNLDVVYTPRFDADRFIDGERISFYSGAAGERVGHRDRVSTAKPDDWFADDEWAFRLYGRAGAFELRGYAYLGFWKSPGGLDAATGKATFPRLRVYGASVRGPLAGGIANLEFGYYDSRDDRDGDDPLVRNGEVRFLLGYERELRQDLTVGLQYYLEKLLDHGAYRRSLPDGAAERDEHRHTVTLRITQLLLQQNLEVGMFVFYTPLDDDAHLRPAASYKLTDQWRVEVGANVFTGKRDHTFWAQFEENSNVWFAIRYGF